MRHLCPLPLVCVHALILLLFSTVSHASEAPRPAGIQWYGTWAGGLAAARKGRRPILLVAAAPHCKHVPGVW